MAQRVLTKGRSEECKRIRHLYKNDIGIPFAMKQYMLRQDDICNTITTFPSDNYILTLKNNEL